MKVCNMCGLPLSLDSFYKNPGTLDKRGQPCKECMKEKMRERSKLPYVKEYDRNRPNAAERTKKNCAREKDKYQKNPEYRIIKMQKQRESRALHKKQYIARNAINNGIRDGIVIPKNECEKCGCIKSLHGHHEDYNKPLDVIWLCTSCHRKRHKEIRALKRTT